MKRNLSTLGICLLAVSLLAAKAVSQTTIRFIEGASSPQWSPDGSVLAFHKNGKLCLYDLESDSIRVAGDFYDPHYRWKDENEIVFAVGKLRRPEGREGPMTLQLTYATIGAKVGEWDTVSERSVEVWCEFGPGLLSDASGNLAIQMGDSAVLLHVNMEQLRARPYGALCAVSHSPMPRLRGEPHYDDYDTWLLDTLGRKVKRVTENRSLFMPELSPDGSVIMARDRHKRNALLLLDLDGGEVADLGHAGGHRCWASGGDHVFYATTIEDDYDILGGDVYRYELSSKTITQVTKTPDIAEFHLSSSLDGSLVAFRTYHREVDGVEIIQVRRE